MDLQTWRPKLKLQLSSLLHVSLTTYRRRIRETIIARWDTLWKPSATGHALRFVDCSPPSLILRYPYTASIPRSTISTLPRLLADFSSLNVTGFRLHQTDSSVCEDTLSAYSADLLGAVDVPKLLTHPKLLQTLVVFVTATGRFS
jgi:hypothetical protein